MRKIISQFVMAAAISLGLTAQASAEDLRIGFAGEINSADPMFHFVGPNHNLAQHIFDRLVELDENLMPVPGLALSWKQVSDTLWEFKIRPNVHFHDGKPLTIDDIAFSIDRADKVPNSPSSYAAYASAVKRVIEVEPTTMQIETYEPHPLLYRDLSLIHIQSKAAAEGKTTADFNEGSAAIGTGPYKLVEWVPGKHTKLARNDNYWGEKPAWENVTIIPITNSSARVATLLSGDIDVIEQIQPIDIPRVKKDGKVHVVSSPTPRLFWLQIDHRVQSPYALSNESEQLEKNPMQDLRVRRAMSKAIDRQLIVDRIMEGFAVPAGQIMPDGFYGSHPALSGIEAYDPEGAKKLLEDAGYPDGFRLTIHTSNDRYLSAEKVVQAIAQMLTHVGIKTNVELGPHSIFRKRGKALELSLQFGGWQSEDEFSMLRGVLHTYDKEHGFGTSNRGRYSNPEVDSSLETALQTADEEERMDLVHEAMKIAIDDLAIIPIYWSEYTWGLRDGLTIKPSPMEFTLAQKILPK